MQRKRWIARLTAFYWAHDPRQVKRVEELLDLHRGREEALLQRVHMQFGVRDFGGEVAVDDLYEHERYSYFSFSWGSSYPGEWMGSVSLWLSPWLMMVLGLQGICCRRIAIDGAACTALHQARHATRSSRHCP